jgi:hypothetical protein
MVSPLTLEISMGEIKAEMYKLPITANYKVYQHTEVISKKYSSLKPLCQMNQRLVGSILGRSSIKIAHLVPIR